MSLFKERTLNAKKVIMLQNEIIAPYDWVLPSGVKKGVQGQKNYLKRLETSIKSNVLSPVKSLASMKQGEISSPLATRSANNKTSKTSMLG